ncbi:hypothetical protein AK830_g9447 [Neonectria ditissima]|uniref:CorA-like transporter domain-containing protein n=1 Tax=Neonectria ditissima TaxID=78410 RepID=A0A0P7B9T1_9HYPO|nr:hypothetical protein AK830_g9447 [Neonectria ditissima]
MTGEVVSWQLVPSMAAFVDSCQNYASFPSNLIQSRHSRRALALKCQTLTEQSKEVFVAEDEDEDEDFRLKFIDIYPPAQCGSVNVATATTQDELQSHIQNNDKDPLFRYVSMTSDSSKDPVNCTSDMFKHLCSYHQIPPSFMDSVFSFRGIDDEYDCGLSMFSDENTLLDRPECILPLQELGRSGREIRHSFLLRAVEKSSSVRKWNWGIRQLAVYHSFDVVTGRTTWITVKGNSLQETQISDAVSECPYLKPERLGSVHESFAATLLIHTLILDWCDDNWRWYINDIEAASRKVTNKVRTFPVDDKERTHGFKRQETHNTMDSSRRTVSFARSLPTRFTFSRSISRSQERHLEEGHPIPLAALESGSRNPSTLDLDEELKRIKRLNAFEIKEMQNLHEVMERIEEMLLVLSLNGRVMLQLREHYQNMTSHYHTAEMESIQSSCRNDIMRFAHRIRAVEDNIEIRKAQLQSLLSLVREGKTLYDTILQQRGIQVTKLYAEVAQRSTHNMELSTQNMETIAHQTKRETSSMHIITFVTLIFLPGTFIAAFFQSGIIKWADVTLGSERWLLNKHAFGLFAAICFPLMLVTVAAWLTSRPVVRLTYTTTTPPSLGREQLVTPFCTFFSSILAVLESSAAPGRTALPRERPPHQPHPQPYRTIAPERGRAPAAPPPEAAGHPVLSESVHICMRETPQVGPNGPWWLASDGTVSQRELQAGNRQRRQGSHLSPAEPGGSRSRSARGQIRQPFRPLGRSVVCIEAAQGWVRCLGCLAALSSQPDAIDTSDTKGPASST